MVKYLLISGAILSSTLSMQTASATPFAANSCGLANIYTESFKVRFDWKVDVSKCMIGDATARIKVCVDAPSTQGTCTINLAERQRQYGNGSAYDFKNNASIGSIHKTGHPYMDHGKKYNVNAYVQRTNGSWYHVLSKSVQTLSNHRVRDLIPRGSSSGPVTQSFRYDWRYSGEWSENLKEVRYETKNLDTGHKTSFSVPISLGWPSPRTKYSKGTFYGTFTISLPHYNTWTRYRIKTFAMHKSGSRRQLGSTQYVIAKP